MDWFDENAPDNTYAAQPVNDPSYEDVFAPTMQDPNQPDGGATTAPAPSPTPGTGGGGSTYTPDPNYHSIDYWAQRGLSPVAIDPATGQAAQANGGLKPGWARTGTGYEWVGFGDTAGQNNPSFPAPSVPDPSNYPAANVPSLRPPPDPLAPWTGTFTAPTKDSILNDPEFQARLENGMRTIQRSAAAKGTLLTGGTLRGLDEMGQQEAGKSYGNAYNRAYNEYDTRRTDFLNNEANRFNSQSQNWQGQFGQEQGIFGDQFANRGQTWGMNSDYFNMGRQNRMDDFNIFNTSDMNNWQKQFDLASLGKPPAPNV